MKSIRSFLHSSVVVLLAVSAAFSAPTNIVPQGPGSVLNWPSLPTVFSNAPDQVSNVGTHHAAVRFGNTDLEVNGVTFSRYTGGGTFANNSLITTTPATVASLGSGGTGNYGALVSTGGYHNTVNSPHVTIGGLTPGRRYQVQMFMPYWDWMWKTYVGASGGLAALLWTGKESLIPPGVCTGNFRATGTSQVIAWVRDPPDSFALMAAISVRLLPEENTMTITENNAAGATVETLVAVDANAGATHTFSLVSGPGSADNASFAMDGSTLKILAPADFETQSSYSIRVQADDGSGGVFSKAFTVNVVNLAEPPEITVEHPAGTELSSGSASIAYGPATVGTAGITKVFTIRNAGLSNLSVWNPGVSGGQAGDFAVNHAGLLNTLPPGAQTSFAVTFNPGGSGTRSTTLTIANNDWDESPFSIALTGTGTGTLVSAPELGVELDGTDLTSEVAAWGLNTSGQASVPAGLKDVVAVAAGHGHTLALKKNGTVVAWGSNSHGQCDVPSGMLPVKMIAAGKWHSLALMTNGQVVMWGDDNGGAYAIPSGLAGVTAIAAGGRHSLALRDDGTVVAWGDNSDGQTTVPAGLAGVTAIAAGERHSLALRGSDQKVFAWGHNGSNQTGVPALLTLTNFINASGDTSYAVSSGGQVTAWGDNSQGQTTLPAGLSGISQIDGGLGHALAKKFDGTLVAWGANTHGQGTLPSAVGTMTRIASGADHNATVGIARPIAFGPLARGTTSAPKTITLRNTGNSTLTIGTVKVTGGDESDFSVDLTGLAGSLPPGGSTTFRVTCTPSVMGDRTTKLLITNSDSDEYFTQIPLNAYGVPQTPSLVNPMYAYLTAHAVKLGANVINDGEATITQRGVVLSVTSSNNNPKIGDPGVIQMSVAGTLGAFWKQVENLNASTTYTFRVYATNASGTSYTTARTFSTPAAKGRVEMRSTDGKPHGGTVLVWGGNSSDMRTNVPEDPDIIAITAGLGHGVALRRNGTVHAWGDNIWAGQTDVPAGLDDVVAVAAGDYFTLALKGDGTVVSWGKDATTGLKPPEGLGGVIAIAAGSQHALALKNDGTVVQWPPTTDMPAHLSGIIGIAAGDGYSVALRGDGTVTGWGTNFHGQINFPAGLVDVVAVAARDATSMVLQSNGYMGVWGQNIYIPDNVRNVAGLGTGDMADMAYTRSGSFIGWGDNSDGKITPPPGLSHVIGIAGSSYATAVMRRELPYGTVAIDAPKSIRFAIRNRGDGPLNISQMTVIGDHPGDFTASTISGANPTAPGEDVVVELTFSPLGEGERKGVLRIQSDDPDVPNFEILLTGTGLAQAPLVSDPTVTAVTHRGAMLGATVIHQAGSPVTQRGVVLSLTSRNANPTLGAVGAMALTTSGTLGTFTLPVSSLLMNREYAMRGFASNATGTNYTEVITFTTPQTALADIEVEHPDGTPVSSPVTGRGYNEAARFLPMPLLPGIVSLGAGEMHTIALTQAGKVIMWGDNIAHQLDVPEELTDVVAVSAGALHSLALNGSGVVFAWGSDWDNQNTVPTDLGSDIIAISAGRFHNLALHRNGTVTGWGANWYGQASPPDGLDNVIAIAGGGGCSAALKNDGTVVTWGRNPDGDPIVTPAGLDNVVAIAAGAWHVIALKDDGTVIVWGNSGAPPEGLRDVVDIAAGWTASLARRADGSIAIWSDIGFGVGSIPVDQTGYQGMAAGQYHSYTVDSMIDFGHVMLGGTAATKTFTIRNKGDASLNLSGVSIIGVHAANFSVTAPASNVLSPGATTTVTVTFTPGATGHHGASLRILSNDIDEGTFDISLKANGITDAPTVLAEPGSDITMTTATLGGDVTNHGGFSITERGVVFSIASENNDPFIDGAGVTRLLTSGALGSFTFPVTQLTPGTTYRWKAYATNASGATGYSSVATFTTGTNYALWASSRFGGATTDVAPEEDFDRDGLQNLIEYALGLNPTQPGVLPLTPDFTAGGYLRLTVPRQGIREDVTYRVEASSDMLNWSSDHLVIEEDSPERLTVRDHLPRSSTPHRFMRLRVAQ